jgi:hypothetical protein
MQNMKNELCHLVLIAVPSQIRRGNAGRVLTHSIAPQYTHGPIASHHSTRPLSQNHRAHRSSFGRIYPNAHCPIR